jgi:Phosphoesterase family
MQRNGLRTRIFWGRFLFEASFVVTAFEGKLSKLALRRTIIFSEAFMRRQAGVVVAATILIALGIVDAEGQDASDGDGIRKIRHVVIIMQENRSFDHYFGTFTGAEGIPMQNGVPTPCLSAPGLKTCFRPYVDHSDRNGGAPHSADAAKRDIDDGKMDGFVAVAATAREACKNTTDPNCGEELNPEFEIAGLGPQRVMLFTWNLTFLTTGRMQESLFSRITCSSR